jgi:hypothetical protein
MQALQHQWNKTFQNGTKHFKAEQNVSKWNKMFQNGTKCFKTEQNVSKRNKMFQSGTFETSQIENKCVNLAQNVSIWHKRPKTKCVNLAQAALANCNPAMDWQSIGNALKESERERKFPPHPPYRE